MSLSGLTERISVAWIKATGRHESPSEANGAGRPHRRGFSVAISREAGTRGPIVARLVGERLGWQVYDHELLEIVARELHVAPKLLEDLDERHISWLQECVEAFGAVPGVREGKYVRHLIEAMLSLGARGQCVIVGRGAPFVLPPASTLRVRLVAPFEDRVAAIAHDQHLPQHEAASAVQRTDRERAQYVRLHFLRDPADPQHYDLILNTSQFTMDECADLIADAARRKASDYDASAVNSRIELQMASA